MDIMENKKNSLKNRRKYSDENEILSSHQSEKIPIMDSNKTTQFSGAFEITSEELENLVSSYTETNNKSTLIENLKRHGGTKGLLQKLKSSPEEGINPPTLLRQEKFGINKIFEEPPAPFIKFLKESLSELMIVILLSAAIIQIIIGLTISDQKKTGWLDGASVLFAVFVVVSVESFTNWQKEKKFFELNNLKKTTVSFKTIRNKKKENIKSEDLVVGDIIFITLGDVIPADLLVIESNNIKIDESSLTGESEPVAKETFEDCITNSFKKNISPIILAGTDCIEGNGKAMVIGVGEKSTKGKIQRMVDNSKDEKTTPLEEKLDVLAKKIGIFAITAGVSTFICLTMRLIFIFISDYKYYKNKLDNTHHNPTMDLVHPKTYLFPRMLENFMITTVIITIALPEGLPMAVALTLAFSLKKLMDKNNLVRKMHSCETMGGADYILTDKTGTLTTNELNVVKIITPNGEIELNDNKSSNKIYIQGEEIRENAENYFKNEKYWNILRTSLSLNVDGHINYLKEPNVNGDIEECESKNKTDHALIKFLYRLKSPISEIEKKYTKNDIKQIPFDSNKKRMSTFVKENDGTYRLYTKGGAENIKKFCKFYINPETGEKKELNHQMLEILEKKIEKSNNNMLRTIYICYKDIKEKDFYNISEEIDSNDLILLALFGIKDTIRK
jgi:magnesium-transporting ATPase (P-type)